MTIIQTYKYTLRYVTLRDVAEWSKALVWKAS